MALTDWSVDRPKQAFATVMLAMVVLASGGMHLQFDNSEDGFFPDDPSVDLLNEVEAEYRANIDFIRVIDEIEQGDLFEASTWTHLAGIEAAMLADQNFSAYHYPLFGTQANNGPAGHAMQWMALQDNTTAEAWLVPLQTAVTGLLMADNDSLDGALANLTEAAANVPAVETVTPDDDAGGASLLPVASGASSVSDPDPAVSPTLDELTGDAAPAAGVSTVSSATRETSAAMAIVATAMRTASFTPPCASATTHRRR